MKISIVGQGKLGSCMTAAFASRGFEVLAIDINQDAVDAINAGHSPDFVEEPRLDEMLSEYSERITASADFQGIADTDATFVIVPTPTPDEDKAASAGVEPGAFSLRYVWAAMGDIGEQLRDKEYHLVVLTSTVLLGDCKDSIIPALEATSGLQVGDNLGFCYSPEFIALGSVIRDFLNPDLILIGESDARAGQILEDVYKALFDDAKSKCSKGCCARSYPPFHRMSIKNAELAKVNLNRYITMKIAFANQTAAICERFEDGDCDAVLGALGDDRRIGPHYLKGALGYGGPCFPRDSRAMAVAMTRVGIDPALPLLVDRLNDDVVARVLDIIEEMQAASVSVMGLAYKPGTQVIEESQAVKIARALVTTGHDVFVWDNLARVDIPGATFIEDRQECASKSEVVLLTLPLNEFYKLEFVDGQTVVDCWRVLRGQSLGEGVGYVGIGLG